MRKDERDALEVLKFELNFLEQGGYRLSLREPWRPKFIFEDSPTCLNYDCKERSASCSDCVLMHWVPLESRGEKVPCRHIPMGPTGETLDSLYRWGDQREIEEAVAGWLHTTIEKLEQERKAASLQRSTAVVPSGEPISLYQKFHPKCANPACPTEFHWLGGGKFFRFRCAPAPQESAGRSAPSVPNNHNVKHFWLCERCSHVFTLAYCEGSGVVLKVRWPELPMTESEMQFRKGMTGEARQPGLNSPSAKPDERNTSSGEESKTQMPTQVGKVMTRNPCFCRPDLNLGSAAKFMRSEKRGFLPVIDSSGKAVGAITDRDICIALGTCNRLPVELTVGEVMTEPLRACNPSDDINSALQTMRDAKVRRLAVITPEGALVGVVSINDILFRARLGKEPKLSSDEVVEAYRDIARCRVPQAPAKQSAAA